MSDETTDAPEDPAVEAAESEPVAPEAPADPPVDAPAPDPAPEVPVEDPAPADPPAPEPAPVEPDPVPEPAPAPAPASADQLPDVFEALRAARAGLEDAEAGVLYCQEIGQAGLHVARALDALEARAARREASGFTGTSSA